jgi:MFS family permease
MTTAPAPRPFGALRLPGFRAFVATFMLTMMADNIEHVMSYWVAFQKFHSSSLGGFAVISHWVPYLVFSVPVGALNDRFDSRRLIQIGIALFMLVSLGWGYFFVTDTLEMWHAMVLLVLHGCAGVFWITSSQMLLYDIVGPAQIGSAVRLNATARYLGMLGGPGVGSVLMQLLGPTRGMFLNVAIYLPAMIWLARAPYGRKFRADSPPPRAVRGLSDIVETFRAVRGIPLLFAMIVLAGAAAFFVANSYQAQMPAFAVDLGHGDPGAAYSALLGADAAGALAGGLMLETGRGLFRTDTRTALKLAMLWAAALGAFAVTRSYPLALVLLFAAGFFELSFSSMTQTIVQVSAPSDIRGRVLGLFGMSSAGLRAFSGLTVGILGSLTSVHVSLAVATGAFTLVAFGLLLRLRVVPTGTS